jgi:hypothetical protein
MPIRPHLDGHNFDPETVRVIGLAYEMARVALRLSERGDLANGARPQDRKYCANR